jgi:hypothetical protein
VAGFLANFTLELHPEALSEGGWRSRSRSRSNFPRSARMSVKCTASVLAGSPESDATHGSETHGSGRAVVLGPSEVLWRHRKSFACCCRPLRRILIDLAASILHLAAQSRARQRVISHLYHGTHFLSSMTYRSLVVSLGPRSAPLQIIHQLPLPFPSLPVTHSFFSTTYCVSRHSASRNRDSAAIRRACLSHFQTP